jgi:hypothetical protein
MPTQAGISKNAIKRLRVGVGRGDFCSCAMMSLAICLTSSRPTCKLGSRASVAIDDCRIYCQHRTASQRGIQKKSTSILRGVMGIPCACKTRSPSRTDWIIITTCSRVRPSFALLPYHFLIPLNVKKTVYSFRLVVRWYKMLLNSGSKAHRQYVWLAFPELPLLEVDAA